MYTEKWAESFNGFSKGEEINLQMFSIFFEKYIANRTYLFLDSSENLLLKLIVESNQLPHLLGLQYWNNIITKNPTEQFRRMCKGELTLENLKNDEGVWKEFRKRIEFIPFSYTMLRSVEIDIRYTPKGKHNSFQRRNIQVIFKLPAEKFIYVLELRKVKDHYVLASSTIYNKNTKIFADKYDKINVDKIRIVEKENILQPID